MNRLVEFLKQAPLLAGMSEDELLRLAGRVRERWYAPGEVLIAEGDVDDILYVVAEGSVDIFKGYGTPEQEKIAERGPGDVVGEMRLLEDAPRFATVVARGSVTVIAIPYTVFIETAIRFPAILSRLGTAMSRKVRQARAELYEELVRKHREASALADLQRAVLTGIVAHELRTPVTNLLLILELAQRVGVSNLPAGQLQDMFDGLQRNAWALDQRVSGLVQFVSVALASTQDGVFLQPTRFDDLAQQAIHKLGAQAAAAGVSLEAKIVTAPLVLPADRGKLSSAMCHLLDNAIKFNRPGGMAVVMVWQEEDTARYEVADTGVGIPADKLPLLWRPFTQVNAGALRRGLEGLGLGLALTRYIVHAHGGEVWGESTEGQGSRFGFWVPKE